MYDAVKPINFGDSMAEEKSSGASSLQINLINKIRGNTALKPTGAILASKLVATAWIRLTLYSCTDDELGRIGKNRPENYQAESQIETLAAVTDIPPPSGKSRQNLRQWLESISAAFQLPPADKLLQYWSRALLYRDLNALAAESTASITIRLQPEKLAEALPPLREDFEAPRVADPDNPVALLIAYTGGTGQSKATVLLGIPLSYDREASVLVPPPQGAVPFFNREWLEPPDPDATKDAYLGSVPDCDDFFAANPPQKGVSWPEYWAYVESFVRTVTYERVSYERREDRQHYKALRYEFDRKERGAWLKDIGTSRRQALAAAGLSQKDIDRMAKDGRPPRGYQVHHRIPLDDGGTNSRDNFILIRDDVEHRALHGYYNPAELRIRLLAYGEKAEVALPVPPKDTLVYPNPSMNYMSKSVNYAKFMEMFDEH